MFKLNRLPIVIVSMFLYACFSNNGPACGCGSPGTCGDKGNVSFIGADVMTPGLINTWPKPVYPTLVGGTQTIQIIDESHQNASLIFHAGNPAFSIVSQVPNVSVTIHGTAPGSGVLEVWTPNKKLDKTTLSVGELVSVELPYTHVSTRPLAFLANSQIDFRYYLEGVSGPLVDESLRVVANNAVVDRKSWFWHRLIIGADTSVPVDVDVTLGGVAQARESFPVVTKLEALTTTAEDKLSIGAIALNQSIELCAFPTTAAYEVQGAGPVAIWAEGALSATAYLNGACGRVEGTAVGPGKLHLQLGTLERVYPIEVTYAGVDLSAIVDGGAKD